LTNVRREENGLIFFHWLILVSFGSVYTRLGLQFHTAGKLYGSNEAT